MSNVLILALNKKVENLKNDVDALIGEVGETGAAGKDGKDGKDGTDGVSSVGKIGPQGNTGATGKQGARGTDGVDGVSLKNALVDLDGMLTFELSDGSVLDAGSLGSLQQQAGTVVHQSVGISERTVLDLISTHGDVCLKGEDTLDFGTGSSSATTVITGQPLISDDSVIRANIKMVATEDHSVDEILLDPIIVSVKDVVVGTGFTIHGGLSHSITHGTYVVQWTSL